MKNGHFPVVMVAVTLMLTSLIGFSPLPISAVNAKPIIIGSALPLGDFHGSDSRDALLLAIKEINAGGGVKVGGEMRPFELVTEDTRCLEVGVPTSETLLAVERLITQKRVDFLIGGPARSESAFPARPLVNNLKKVWIVSVGTYSPGFGDSEKYPYSFRVTGEVNYQVAFVWVPFFKFLREKFNFNKIVLLGEDVRALRLGVEGKEKLLKGLGFEIVDKRYYPSGTTDFSIGLLEAKKRGAQVVNFNMQMPQSNIMMKQFHDLKIPAMPYGFLGPAYHMDFWEATQGKCEYLMVDVLVAGQSPSNATPWTMKFVKAFEKEYGHEPDGYGHSTSYMAVYVLKDAIERAGTLDSDAVVKSLEKTDMIGVYGRMRFDKNHEIIFDPDHDPQKGAVSSIFQWQKGKRG